MNFSDTGIVFSCEVLRVYKVTTFLFLIIDLSVPSIQYKHMKPKLNQKK